MKKVLQLSAISAGVLAATLFLSTSAFAANYKGEGYKGEAPCPPPEPGLMGGFYVGGELGYDMWRVRENFNSAGVASANPTLSATGIVGDLFLGYGQYWSNYYYLGAEVLGGYSNASSSWSANSAVPTTYTNKFNAYGDWGIAVLPGIKLNNATLLYARLGYNWDRLKASESATAPGYAASASTTKWSGGFAYGLGLETLVSGNWSMRTEYSHTNNNSFSTSNSTSINPSKNQVMVGVVYHFA